MKTSSSRRCSLLDQYQHHSYNSQSFSSSLLEEIYRSFDDDNRDHPNPHCDNHSTNTYKRVKINNSTITTTYKQNEPNHHQLRGAHRFALDRWINNTPTTTNNIKVNFHRHSMAAMTSSAKFNSSSSASSSDSSSGIGGFSSDTESFYGSSKSKVKPALKPIRTNLTQPEFHRESFPYEIPAKKMSNKNNKEGNLQKRALKLYGELKKVKQPISPGGKLASFLNSLFNSNSSKKPKISSSTSLSSNSLKCSTSTSSTASSYSRSCLSKTPSSAGKFERRSVRFCPVSTVIAADKECVDVDRKTTSYRNNESRIEIMEKHRRVEEVAKELLKNYQQNNNKNKNKNNNIGRYDIEDEDDEDEDDASCCSSDLFELENLIGIGGEHHQRYCEELPVYETTHVHTNRAIANGFIL